MGNNSSSHSAGRRSNGNKSADVVATTAKKGNTANTVNTVNTKTTSKGTSHSSDGTSTNNNNNNNNNKTNDNNSNDNNNNNNDNNTKSRSKNRYPTKLHKRFLKKKKEDQEKRRWKQRDSKSKHQQKEKQNQKQSKKQLQKQKGQGQLSLSPSRSQSPSPSPSQSASFTVNVPQDPAKQKEDQRWQQNQQQQQLRIETRIDDKEAKETNIKNGVPIHNKHNKHNKQNKGKINKKKEIHFGIIKSPSPSSPSQSHPSPAISASSSMTNHPNKDKYQYEVQEDEATSPTGTDCSHDRSFGMDSLDIDSTASPSPQRSVFIDDIDIHTTAMIGHGGDLNRDHNCDHNRDRDVVGEDENDGDNDNCDSNSNILEQEEREMKTNIKPPLPHSHLFSIEENEHNNNHNDHHNDKDYQKNKKNTQSRADDRDIQVHVTKNITNNHYAISRNQSDNGNDHDHDDHDDQDEDELSVASSKESDQDSDNGNNHMFHKNCDESCADDGSESLLSQGSCTEFDNMSRVSKVSRGIVSISDRSLSSIPSLIINNKQIQRDKMEKRIGLSNNKHRNNDWGIQRTPSSSSSITSFHSSMTSTPSFYTSHNVLGSSNRSIHCRRTIMKRSRSGGSNSSRKRPTASNAFETLPRHLIKTGLVRQVASTLRDERFVNRRIEKLGAEHASKVHVADFELLQKRDKRMSIQREKERDVEGGGLEAAMPTAQMFPDGDDYFSVLMDSFDLFLKLIMDMCGVVMDSTENIFEIDEGCEELAEASEEDSDDENDENDNDNIENEKENEDILPESKIHRAEPKIPPLDGGKAILSLGKFLQSKEWIDDAMYYFRHALYLFLLEVDVDEPRLLDEAEDCDGLFYLDVATEGSQGCSPAHEFLGMILTKMGDVHGKNLEVNDALRAYRASQVFWGAYLRNHEVVKKEENNDKDENLDELTDYAASVEGLALAHNRVGGVYTSKGDLPAALGSFHEALDLQIDALGDDHLEVAKTLHNIGVCHRHNDEWDEALEYYRKAHLIFEKNLGESHLDTARTLHNIGGVFRRKKFYQEAMDCFHQVLRVRRRILGDDHPSVSITLVSIAAVLRRSGRSDEANKFYSAAVR